MNYLPKNFHEFRYQIQRDDAYLNIIYIYAGKKAIKDLDDFRYNSDVIASVQFYTNDETDEATVTSVDVLEKYRGRGYSYYLLLQMAKYLEGIGIQTIELDDDSDNYRKKNNLYTSLGFEYLADFGPEMFANVSTILRKRNFDHFQKKWPTAFLKRKRTKEETA